MNCENGIGDLCVSSLKWFKKKNWQYLTKYNFSEEVLQSHSYPATLSGSVNVWADEKGVTMIQ